MFEVDPARLAGDVLLPLLRVPQHGVASRLVKVKQKLADDKAAKANVLMEVDEDALILPNFKLW